MAQASVIHCDPEILAKAVILEQFHDDFPSAGRP
jgi:hypothetical protein